MASFPNTFATKLVVGTEIGAGVFIQKVPYENSLTGGLSVLNGPVVCGVFPTFPGLGTVNDRTICTHLWCTWNDGSYHPPSSDGYDSVLHPLPPTSLVL